MYHPGRPPLPNTPLSHTMKLTTNSFSLMAICALGVTLSTGCGSLPKHVPIITRQAAPPPGKALVNFHRPSNWGGGEFYAIFDGNGTFLCDLPGGSEFQYLADPGEHIFLGWADQVSVIKADLEADKIYDVMVDIGMGWIRGNIKLVPLAQGDERRAELPKFEKREKRVVGMNRTDHVVQYEQKHQQKIQEIKRDFVGGEKADRLRYLRKEDAR
jgi:hypothetical protein